MKNILLQQRNEMDKLLEVDYQDRFAQKLADGWLDSRPIKLITGPRRAGKSVLALQLLKDKNFAYLNFDDSQLLDKFSEDAVGQALNEVYPGFDYLLLDEVQNLNGWSLWVEKLYRGGTNLIITGSNANMLSDDIATVLSGRYIEIRLFPFSLKEYMDYCGYNRKDDTSLEIGIENSHIETFMVNGGYPEVARMPQVISGYLSSLYDAMLVKDIVKRYHLRKIDQLYNISDWLLSNFTNPFSATSLAEEIGMSSTTTVQKFCEYLQNTYLFQYLPRFDNKLKLMKKADRKVYVVDNGFVMARAFELSKNLGRLLENLVFLELLKRGYDLKKYELFYYRSRNNREVDFVCRKGVTIEQLIQVSYNIDSPKTLKREVDAITECAGELRNSNLTIITWDTEKTLTSGDYTIKVLPLRKWVDIHSY